MIRRSPRGSLAEWSVWVRATGVVLALIAFAALAFGSAEASAAPTFPTSPLLDNFTTDTSLVASPTSWTTPALDGGTMGVVPVAGSDAHELTGTGTGSGSWDAAIWNPPFTSPVEVWATINRAGTNDATLVANVTGGASGTTRPSSGYFVDFGGTASGGSTSEVSLWRIDGPEVKLTSIRSPYVNLNSGDEIGLSVSSTGVLIAWYRPSGGSWSAVVSWRDLTYGSGNIAVEAIPGAAYGFSNFGGGTPATPIQTAVTATSIAASAAGVTPGQQVTYTATVSPAPSGGTISFADNGVAIPDCGAQVVNASGKATCKVTYTALGTHVVTALYTGSPDGEFAGSTNGPDAIVRVIASTSGKLVATNTRLSLSSATPATRTAVRYTASVSPAPDGGTVSFTDGDGNIRGCTSQPVTTGSSTCKVTFAAAGIHQIRAAYSGDAHFGGSDSASAQVTVSKRPSLHVAKQSLIVTSLCPKQSGGCRLTSTIAVTPQGVKKAINLKRLSTKLKAGKTGRFTFGLSARTRAALRSDLRQHHSDRLGVTVHIVVRDGNGSNGTQTFSFTLSGARARSLLGMR